MNIHFDPITIPILVSIAVAVAVAVYAWRLRADGTWVMPFLLLVIALVVWSLGYALELSLLDLTLKIAWTKVEYFGIVTVPVAWFLFALEYSGRQVWGVRRYMASLFTVPLITLALVLTNEAHHLIWSTLSLSYIGITPTLDVEYGFWFWVHSAYSYILILAGTFLLLRTLGRFPNIKKWQLGVLMLAPIIPLLGNGLYLSGLSPLPQLDLTPASFTISGIIIAWAIFHLRIFKIALVARRTVVENMSDGMIVLNLENHILDLNAAAVSILGKQLTEIKGKSLQPLLVNGPKLVEKFDSQGADKKNLVLDIQEDEEWYEVRVSPIQDDSHSLRGRVLVLRNITDRKKSEAFLAQRNYVLQTLNQISQEMSSSLELQTLLNTAVKSATEALNLTSGYINDWDPERGTNKVLAEYFAPSASPEEIVSDLGVSYPLEADFGSPEEWTANAEEKYIFHIDDPSLSPIYRAHMKQYGAKTVVEVPLYAKGKPIGTLELWESRYKREFTEDEITLLLEIARLIAIAMDNAHLYESALSAIKLKSRILARVSHELRTPLGIIKLYAEMLQYSNKFNDLSEEGQKAISRIINGADDLTDLVADLLDQATLEANTMHLNAAPFNPTKLLEIVQNQMIVIAEKKEIEFTATIDPNMPEEMFGDSRRLQQIMVNLIENAIKYTDQGSVAVCIYPRNKTQWAIEVADTGRGISVDAQAYIYEPFHQGDQMDDTTGAGIGLGLSIVKQLVGLMDGRILMDSKLGKGSTFTVLLPLRETAINDKYVFG